ncbi:MAG TPA: NAD(P)/FAD-dependent oxidoreductase, partial [Polyangiaceae bacterium]
GYTGETPRSLSTTEVEDLISAFAVAAVRAQEAGFDGVELLGSSGYLVSQFLSPLTNQRTDKFGGTETNRSRFPIEVIKEIRRYVGADFNLSVKIDAEDGMQGGMGLPESKRLAKSLEQVGVDRLHVWAGWHESPRPMLPLFVPSAAFADLAAEIKRSVSVPVTTVGRISDPYRAAELIREGKSDLVGIGRALLSDPDFVVKAQNNRSKEIRPCIACCHCFDQVVAAVRADRPLELTCAVNPTLGRESEELIQEANIKRRIAVVGSGPAGLEAARISALRGHYVTIYEASERLGGLLNVASIPPHKQGLQALIDYYATQMELLGVALRFGVCFDASTIETERPEVVVLATGAISSVIPIRGVDCTHALTATEALCNTATIGQSVVVIGGGMIGLETAEHLAAAGRHVTVVEMGQIASDMSPTARNAFVLRLRKSIKILSSTRALAIQANAVIVSDAKSNEKQLHADTVVFATGLDVRRDLVQALNAAGVEFYLAGSCKVPGIIDEAIADGFRVGCAI